jgi:hypothetical protein
VNPERQAGFVVQTRSSMAGISNKAVKHGFV